MNRRGFLKALLSGTAGAVAAHTLDLDRLLWVPGEKTIFLPSPHCNSFVTPDWVTHHALEILKRNLEFSRCINREYDQHFSRQLVKVRAA